MAGNFWPPWATKKLHTSFEITWFVLHGCLWNSMVWWPFYIEPYLSENGYFASWNSTLSKASVKDCNIFLGKDTQYSRTVFCIYSVWKIKFRHCVMSYMHSLLYIYPVVHQPFLELIWLYLTLLLSLYVCSVPIKLQCSMLVPANSGNSWPLHFWQKMTWLLIVISQVFLISLFFQNLWQSSLDRS